MAKTDGRPTAMLLLPIALLAVPLTTYAHGFAGKRFFPSTLATEDPFVSDELSLTSGYFKDPGDEGGSVPTTETSFDYTKRITPNFGISVGDSFVHMNPDGAPDQNGMQSLELGVKYLVYTSDAHETLISLGIDSEIGGTGSSHVGADTFSTVSPSFFFGKGFGDLPDSMWFLKPLAITGAISFDIPTEASTATTELDSETQEPITTVEQHPNTLSGGFAIEYNLNYLQNNVRDVGLKGAFARLVPLIEIPLEDPVNHGSRGQVTGTINPGIIWFGKSFQLGIEAVIPMNDRTGNSVGVLAQIHFFIDDIFPNSLGRPIIQ